MNDSMAARKSPAFIRGQLLRMSEHRAVAIYLRNGTTWVADFVDGHGVLVPVDTWFRFNCGSLANAYALRRIALESALPLPDELMSRIEELHRSCEPTRPHSGRRWMSALLALAAAARGGSFLERRRRSQRRPT